MRPSKQIPYAIDDAGAGKFDAALLHACCAVDATAKRLYPKARKVGDRYKRCLRQYYWLLEPMMGAGFNLEETRFNNAPLERNPSPDFADIVYNIFRCSQAHGDEVPKEFSVLPSEGNFHSRWLLGNGEVHMPDRVIWALLSVVVLSHVNKQETTSGTYYLSLGDERFLVSEWWGREDDFRPIAARYNKVRVKMDGLERLERSSGHGDDKIVDVKILNPPFV